MKKRVIALTLSAVLALSSTSAFAADQTNCTKANLNSNNNLLKNYVSKFNNSNHQFKVTLNGKTINLNELYNNYNNKVVTKPVETQKPEVQVPEVKEPEVQAPEVKEPEVKEPVNKVPAPEAPAKNTENTDTTVSSSVLNYEQKVVELVNIERQKAGLPALTLDSKISSVARAKSKDMATNNYFAHQSPTYGSAGNMLTQFGIKWSAWGENIAYGQNTPEIVVNAWMNSPGHRANILSSNFGKIGVGYVVNSNGRPYWTQIFTN